MTGKTRIWFNRGFSLAPIAGLMRAADPTLDVFVSVSQQSVHYTGPTETWIDGGDLEPDDKNGYLDWVREMITVHEIDIFIPTRPRALIASARSEEHTSELQSLMRISYAVFCLKKKKQIQEHPRQTPRTEQHNKTHY